MIAIAVRDIIVGDAGVAAQFATFDFGSGEKPAVFTYDSFEGKIPKNCPLPAAIIDEIGGVSDGTRGQKGARTSARVRVYGNKDRGTILKPLMDDLFFLLARAKLVVQDREVFNVVADPATSLNDPDGFPGYFIVVTATVHEEC